jgi:hypothetical protein
METSYPTRNWQVLLIGGASGVGKTQISYRLAQHFGIGITEVDDFQVILERMSNAEQYAVLHFWRSNPEAAQRMSEEEHLQFFISYAKVMAEALELVIANHIESRAPLVLEGDFILPELATLAAYDGIDAASQVRGLFIYEPDEAQIARNFLARSGEQQLKRARSSWRNSEWLRDEAARLGVPAIAARPWETVLERAIAVTSSVLSRSAAGHALEDDLGHLVAAGRLFGAEAMIGVAVDNAMGGGGFDIAEERIGGRHVAKDLALRRSDQRVMCGKDDELGKLGAANRQIGLVARVAQASSGAIGGRVAVEDTSSVTAFNIEIGVVGGWHIGEGRSASRCGQRHTEAEDHRFGELAATAGLGRGKVAVIHAADEARTGELVDRQIERVGLNIYEQVGAIGRQWSW